MAADMQEYRVIAPLYDRVIGPALGPLHRCMADVLAAGQHRKVLDLCCGTGLLSSMAAQKGVAIIGVDLSPHMLKAAGRHRPGLSFVQGDCTALPFASREFDAATLSFALHEKPVDQGLAILAEARRVLIPRGRIIVADYRSPGQGTGRLSGFGINVVERLAGQGHHARFRAFMDGGGTPALLSRAGLSGRLLATFFNGWAGVYSAA